MGFKHSVYLLQQIVQFAITRTLFADLRFSNIKLLNEASGRGSRTYLSDDMDTVSPNGAVYVHLDDVGVVSRDPSFCRVLRDAFKATLVSLNFVVTVDCPMTSGKYVGYLPRSLPARWEPATLRLGALVRTLDLLVQADTVNTDILHSALAVFIWLALLWRPALSLPFHMFSYIRTYPHMTRPLPDSIITELKYMLGMLPFVYADLGRHTASSVLSQDASGMNKQDTTTETSKFFEMVWCLGAFYCNPSHQTSKGRAW